MVMKSGVREKCQIWVDEPDVDDGVVEDVAPEDFALLRRRAIENEIMIGILPSWMESKPHISHSKTYCKCRIGKHSLLRIYCPLPVYCGIICGHCSEPNVSVIQQEHGSALRASS